MPRALMLHLIPEASETVVSNPARCDWWSQKAGLGFSVAEVPKDFVLDGSPALGTRELQGEDMVSAGLLGRPSKSIFG